MPRLVFALVGLFLFLGLTISGADAGDNPKEALIGKWKEVDSKNNKIVEFTKDGKMIGTITNASGKKVTSTDPYKFVGDDKISFTVDVLGKKTEQSLKFKVTKDELTTTNDFGGTAKYKRTK